MSIGHEVPLKSKGVDLGSNLYREYFFLNHLITRVSEREFCRKPLSDKALRILFQKSSEYLAWHPVKTAAINTAHVTDRRKL